MSNRKEPKSIRNASRICTSASVAALLAVGAVMPALAQESNDDLVEEVVVTGQRASIKSAQAIKQSADQVVDSITAVDIGALPDRSVSEALQRIPGVQLQRTNSNRDPARLSAEGGGVFVRGLGWVRTELNGRDIFSADNGRSLGFEDVSADLMAGVDVYKSPTANQVEGGLGGTVNLRTRLPFDQDGRLFAGAVDYNDADMLDKGFTSSSALYSDRWEVGVGEMGFLFSASIAEIGNRTDAIQTGRYKEHQVGTDDIEGLDAGNYYLPGSIGFRRVDWEQDRNSFYGAFQWAPNQDLTISATALRAEATPIDVERAVSLGFADWETWQGDQWWSASFDIAPSNGTYRYNSENELVGGTINDATTVFNTRYGKRESATTDFALKFEYTPSEQWTITGDVQKISSSSNVLSMTVYTMPLGDRSTLDSENGIVHGTNFPSVTFNLDGDPSISVSSQERLSQQSEYVWAAAMDHIEHNEADSKAGRLDAEYMFQDDGLLKSVLFGTRVTQKDAITRQSGYNWSMLSHQFYHNWAPPPTVFLDEYAEQDSELYVFDDFMRGSTNVPTVGWFAKQDVVESNVGAYAHLSGASFGWSPLLPPDAYDFNPRADNVSAGINRQEETTSAIYGMLKFGGDSLMGMAFDGNIGLRVVKTETTAWGRSASGNASNDCGSLPVPTDACASAKAFADAYNADPVNANYLPYENSYTNALPSLNLRLHLADDLQLRAGLSRSMVRPEFSKTRPSSTLSFEFDGVEFKRPDEYEGTGTRGAPGLKPIISDNFDMSLEWFFADSSNLSGAIFYKRISDYISLRTGVETLTYGGESLDFEVTQQVNAEDGKLKGFELAYSQFFDFLPTPLDGFGIQANFTYIDNEGGVNSAVNPFDTVQQENAGNQELPIEGISETSYNLALMYEKYDISARLAYNWREKYLLTASAANLNVPTWMKDYGQLDGSIFYTVNDHLKLGLQATNLLKSQTEIDVGYPDQIAPYSWTDTDRRVALVARWQF